MKPALLVIDMQKKYQDASPGAKNSMHKAVEYIEFAIELFGKKNLPVFHVLQEADDPAAPKGEDFWELDAIAVKNRNDAVLKEKNSGFVGTDLGARLTAAGADCVVITGFAAEYCVLSTTRDAADHGWKPILLEGAIAGIDETKIPFVLDINDHVTATALETLLG